MQILHPNMVVKVYKTFFEGEIPEAFVWGVLVIIPKGNKGRVREKGFLEAVHKVVSQIINLRIAIEFEKRCVAFKEEEGPLQPLAKSKSECK